MARPVDASDPLVCVGCGLTFRRRAGLLAHWEVTGHGPKQRQADSLDRARASISGDDVPLRTRLREEEH
ncbi:MAG: hypothetical protein ACLQBX_17825 [Candidatus Limnocylindrales bacterium]|jgi:hypothetical protein